MAFVVEDGSGVIGATSNVALQEYKDYFIDRGSTPTESDPDIQIALIRGTDYIDTQFARSLRGIRQFEDLASRSILTFTAVPTDGETITVGSVVYTFRTTPVDDTDIEIAANLFLTLIALSVALTTAENEDFLGVMLSGVTGMVMYTLHDGIVTTETLANGSFDVAASVGFSPDPQPLEFPRVQLFDIENNNAIEGMPPNLKIATILYANRAIDSVLLPDPTVDASGLQLTGTVTKVGPIEIRNTFSELLVRQVITPYPAADLLMADFTSNNSGTIRA